MKPDFALDFRGNQITLRHRSEGGWSEIGHVAMDDPDLEAAVGYLRASALGLSPRGFATKLILPNDAILFTSLPNLPDEAGQRARAIAAALVGRTPYDVADLVYDWTDSGDTAHVAVIARETLDEAEGFASQHRFNPVSFAAIPDQGKFDGEVWFGATQLSETLLAKGEVVERDDVSLMVDRPAAAPAENLGAQDFEMGADAPDVAEATPATQADAAEDTADPEPPLVKADDLNAPAQKDDAREVWQDFMAEADDPAVLSRAAEAETDPSNSANAPLLGKTATLAEGANSVAAGGDDEGSFDAVMHRVAAEDVAQTEGDRFAKAPLPDDEAPMAVDVPLMEDIGEADAPVPPEPAEKAQTKAEGLLSAFSARRAAALAQAETQANSSFAAAPKTDAVRRETPLGLRDEAPAPAVRANKSLPNPALAPPPTTGSAIAGGAAALRLSADLGTSVSASSAAPPIAAPLRPVPVKHVPAKKTPRKPQDLSAMPGAKTNRNLRLGWILTIVLLLSLVAAAALSSYLLEAFNRNFLPSTSPATLLAGATPSAGEATAGDATAGDVTAGDVGQHATIVADGGAILPLPQAHSPAILAVPRAADEPNAPLAAPRLPPPAWPAAAAAAAQQAAPPPAEPALPKADAVAAVVVAAAPPPAAPDSNSSLGVPVQLGAPPLAPPARPDIAPVAAAAEQTATVFGEVFADPALANARPSPRPASLQLAGLPVANNVPAAVYADPALADARPAPRPASILAASRAARLATAPASLVASAAIDAAELALLNDGPDAAPLSALALAVSPMPSARPRGLKDAFDAQRAAAQAAAAAALAAADVPTAEPAPSDDVAAAEASNQEEVTRNGGGATRSVVEKQATMRNAMNLGNVNLVGIFGTSANRYALIRNPSGTFKKLKVGDRVDGGRVAAITDSEVRYDKGGELLALRMPSG